MMMGDNIESFRKKFLSAMRAKIVAANPATASPGDLILQSAMLKSYDLVDNYQALTPERTEMILEMSAKDFAAWVELPRNQFALEETLVNPVAVEIIFRDDTAAGVVAGDATAMRVIAASEAVMTVIAASEAAMNVLITSPVALAAIWKNNAAIAIVQANAEAWAILVTASADVVLAGACIIAGTSLAQLNNAATIAASSAAMAAIAASSIAMNAIAVSAPAMNVLITAPVALAAVWKNNAAIAIVKANDAAYAICVSASADVGMFGACIIVEIDPAQYEGAGDIAETNTAMVAIWKNNAAFSLMRATPAARAIVHATSADTALAAACVLANVNPAQFNGAAAIVSSSAAMTAISASSVAMNAIAEYFTALHPIIKNSSARTIFCASNYLQPNATAIREALNAGTLGANKLFTKRASGAAQTGVGTQSVSSNTYTYYGLVGFDSSGNYTAGTNTSKTYLSPGNLFVFVITMGSNHSSNVTIYAKHLLNQGTAGTKPSNGGAYNGQPANFICVGGSLLEFSASTSYTAGMTYDAWEAV
jgi:hypothetical protein